MRNNMIGRYAAVFMALCAILCTECGHKKPTAPRGYDIETKGIPKFVRLNYLDLDRIARISKFRSAFGHSYSDDFEHCRSMKHYFEPKGDGSDWSTIPIYSPVSGTVWRMFEEWAGTQVWISTQEYPDISIAIFHIKLKDSLQIGQPVSRGQVLGNHIGGQTMSDIAVSVNTTRGWKLISYFDVMTDSLFQAYQARGVSSRDQLIISKEARDADTLTCDGESFTSQGQLEDWVVLR